jgi:hypothetical protein
MDCGESSLFGEAAVDGVSNGAPGGGEQVAKSGDVREGGGGTMARNHGDKIELKNAVEASDPAIEIAVAEPGTTPDKQQITKEGDAGTWEVDDDVAVAMGRPPIEGFDIARFELVA